MSLFIFLNEKKKVFSFKETMLTKKKKKKELGVCIMFSGQIDVFLIQKRIQESPMS